MRAVHRGLRGGWWPAVLVSLLAVWGTPTHACAQLAQRIGHGADGLPALRHVGVVDPGSADAALVGGLGYGLLEPVVSHDDRHHRFDATLAASLRPLPALAFGLRLDARNVQHTGGPQDGDGGTLTRTRAVVRGGFHLSEQLRLGVEGALRLPPAQTVARAIDNVGTELNGLLTYLPSHRRLLLATSLGLRLDNAADAVGNPARYSPSDRVTLDAVNGTAVAWGVGVTYRTGPIDVLWEWSWDMYTGREAPTLSQSPMRFVGGVRHWFDPRYHLDLLAAVSPSARPDPAADAPLSIHESRYFFGASLVMRIGVPTASARPVEKPEAAAPAPAPEPPGAVEGIVRGPDGEPVGGARVRYTGPDGPVEVVADAEGRFRIPALPAGVHEVEVQAEGYQPFKLTVGVGGGKTTTPEVVLERPLPQGQIRGTVKDFRGRPIRARVEIEPLGATVRTDAAGEFEVDVPPGDYTVTVRARGFRRQRRPAKVHDNGVTVVIVDLRER